MKPNTTGRVLSTTEASLQIVDHIVRSGGATAAELSDELGLAHSTVHNHLNTLSQYGYVVRETTTYDIGAKFCHIGDYVRRRKPEYLIADDIVAELGQTSDLEADFAVEENGHVISLYSELNFADDSHFLTAGRFFHVHSTASGKAMLAEYPAERVRRIIDQWGLPQKTNDTITSEDDLFDELERVREQGYATSEEEAMKGLWAIAMTVQTPMGDVCGSLNLSAPTYLHDDVRRSAIETLEETVTTFETRIEETYAELYDGD